MSTIPDTTVQLKDGSTITIRTARPEDVRAVLEHARPIFAEEEFLLTMPDDFHMTEEQEEQWLQMNCDDPGKLVIVAESAGRIIGLLGFESEERKRVRHHGELGMSVNKAWRERSVGRALLLALIAGRNSTRCWRKCTCKFSPLIAALSRSIHRSVSKKRDGRYEM